MQPKFDLPNPQDWVDARTAADMCGVKLPTLWDWLSKGTLTTYKIGTHRLFWRAEVVQMAAARKVVKGA
jgi:excisionase family DNA binding protein